LRRGAEAWKERRVELGVRGEEACALVDSFLPHHS